jgi:hypothetical protein
MEDKTKYTPLETLTILLCSRIYKYFHVDKDPRKVKDELEKLFETIKNSKESWHPSS